MCTSDGDDDYDGRQAVVVKSGHIPAANWCFELVQVSGVDFKWNFSICTHIAHVAEFNTRKNRKKYKTKSSVFHFLCWTSPDTSPTLLVDAITLPFMGQCNADVETQRQYYMIHDGSHRTNVSNITPHNIEQRNSFSQKTVYALCVANGNNRNSSWNEQTSSAAATQSWKMFGEHLSEGISFFVVRSMVCQR